MVLQQRHRGLLKRNEVTHGYWVRGNATPQATARYLRRFSDLAPSVDLFTRCLVLQHTPRTRVEGGHRRDAPPAARPTTSRISTNAPTVAGSSGKGSHYRAHMA